MEFRFYEDADDMFHKYKIFHEIMKWFHWMIQVCGKNMTFFRLK